MGDWDRMFGCGTSAESVIDRINRSWEREEREAYRASSGNRRATAMGQTTGGNGQSKEVFFATFEELQAWDRKNPNVQFTRVRDGNGWRMKLL